MKNMGANRSEMGKVANPVTHAFNCKDALEMQ